MQVEAIWQTDPPSKESYQMYRNRENGNLFTLLVCHVSRKKKKKVTNLVTWLSDSRNASLLTYMDWILSLKCWCVKTGFLLALFQFLKNFHYRRQWRNFAMIIETASLNKTIQLLATSGASLTALLCTKQLKPPLNYSVEWSSVVWTTE
jgi:hypothetical protein